MAPDVTCNLATTGGVADMYSILQVKFFGEGCEIVGISVHLVAIPCLRGTAVSSPVVGDNSKATLAEEQHLRVPVVRGEGPAVTEHYRLSRPPVLVENLRTVFGRNRWHKILLLGWLLFVNCMDKRNLC